MAPGVHGFIYPDAVRCYKECLIDGKIGGDGDGAYKFLIGSIEPCIKFGPMPAGEKGAPIPFVYSMTITSNIQDMVNCVIGIEDNPSDLVKNGPLIKLPPWRCVVYQGTNPIADCTGVDHVVMHVIGRIYRK